MGHSRRAPLRHGFSYALTPWLVDLDRLDAHGHPLGLARALRPLAAFRAADHFDGTAPTLRTAVDRWCAAHEHPRPRRVLTLAQPRALGYVFNPISLHWCYGAHDPAHDSSRGPYLVLAEVHNTYGGRHVYPVPAGGPGPRRVDKALPVSPFFSTEGHYEMTISDPGERLDVSITLALPTGAADPAATDRRATGPGVTDRETRPFVATLRGHRRAITVGAVLGTHLRQLWPSLRVSALIRRQGLALWRRGRRGALPVQAHADRNSRAGVR